MLIERDMSRFPRSSGAAFRAPSGSTSAEVTPYTGFTLICRVRVLPFTLKTLKSPRIFRIYAVEHPIFITSVMTEQFLVGHDSPHTYTFFTPET